MPLPRTQVDLSAALAAGRALRFLPVAAGDFAAAVMAQPVAAWMAGISDLNADGRPDFIFGAPGDDDKLIDAGRVFVYVDALTPGSSSVVDSGPARTIIDGVNAGDRAGTAVGAIADLNGDGRAEILVGAPGMENGAIVDAGAAFVIWGSGVANGIDLADPFSGGGGGYAIKGQSSGDAAGTTLMSIGDLNGDGKAEVLVGAPGNDAGGANAGAVYVVWGKSTGTPVTLSSVAAGTGGFRIIGDSNGDAAGTAIGTVGDLNGDGRAEILIGTPDSKAGGTNSGAVYVVFGKSTGTAVDLTNVAAGTGGFRIIGVAQDDAGAAVAGLGDVNGDGLSDILIGAPRSDSAYVVYGKSSTTEVDLADVALGIGGFRIVAESVGDLDLISVAGGGDLNRDGISDIVIGASAHGDGGAVYAVWGGGSGTVELSMVAQSFGGAKITGASGSGTGAAVSIIADVNGDGASDLMIAAPGSGESFYTLFADPSWQPDLNIYGTEGDDTIGAGYGGLHKVGATNDAILGLGGFDSISGGEGADSIEGDDGDDTLAGEGGADLLDGGAGADSMLGGLGDDTYVVDDAGDTVVEAPGEGTDTVLSGIDLVLGADIENLTLTGFAHSGTGNALANVLTGGTGADTLDGAGGLDTLAGGLGNDTYRIDNPGVVITEAALAGTDSVIAAIDMTLGANLENLTLTGAARHATGNTQANQLTGTVGDDVLDGAGGNDTMAGGGGNDSYLVDTAGDVISEGLGAGTDSVTASVNLTLAANVENLTLTGAARIGVGNAFANAMTGTAGDDSLDGAAGDDTLTGGLGADTYRVDSAADVIVEAAGGGNDTVFAAFDYTLSADLESLVLTGAARRGTGNAGANSLTGTTGADSLDGAGGADTMTGGLGDDRYVFDSALDSAVEASGGGIDTVVASFDLTLGAEIERLELSGAGTHGTGNTLDNTLTGAAGSQALDGGIGNDSIDGGLGADTMTGGAGDDTFTIDDAGDVVIEDIGGGTDTVVTAFDVLTIAENIENVRLTGTAHAATGNSGANRLSGGSGDDTLDGAGGDDLELGGDGNDRLVSRAGHDALSGGSGDDRYVVAGGRVDIEDFLGHDTIDASEATGNSSIDLSGEVDSEIEGQICHFGTGGTTSSPIDVQFLQDLSGSFGDDIATVRGLVPGIVGALRAVQADSRFGVSSFIDKPVSPFGATGEWVYRLHAALTADATALTATYNSLGIGSGLDGNEAQIESLMQLALRGGELGFRADSAHFAVLFTDAPYHVAGDGVLGGITTPNNGDALTPGDGALEDYPMVAQVQAALAAANVIPIFAIAGGFESVYQGLVTSLGRGAVVTLTANSSNVVSAITAGLTAATTTRIEDAIGGAGDDSIKGNIGANHLSGGNGNDGLTGGLGDDSLDGGIGTDTAFFSGSFASYAITLGAGTASITGADGTDTLTGIELLSFTDGTVEITASTIGTVFDIAATDAIKAEGNAGSTSFTFTVTRSGGTLLAQDVAWTVTGTAGTGFTAVDAADFAGAVLPAGVLTFAAGETSRTITVQVAGDAIFELEDRFAVALSAPAFGASLGVAVAEGRILNDDAVPTKLTGTAGADTLDGAYGDIRMSGLLGDDTYLIDSAGDLAIEKPGEGTDTVLTALAIHYMAANIETLIFTGTGPFKGYGNSNANSITGGAGNDSLNGGAGSDTTIGLGGDDTYYVNAAADLVVEAAGGGKDTVFAAVNYALDAAAEVEMLTAQVLALTLTGNDFAQGIIGSAGADTLIGGGGNDSLNGAAGADSMAGGTGDDTYTISTISDVVSELAGEGLDTVRATVSYTLAAGSEVEVLAVYATNAGLTLTGNAFNNRLTGGNGADHLNGGDGNDVMSGLGGADTMTGGLGNDSYYVENVGDVVTEAAGEGSDTVRVAVNYILASASEMEFLLANAGATGLAMTGNAFANTIIGAAGADTIDGGGGPDRLAGGTGADLFVFRAGQTNGDVLTDFVAGLDRLNFAGFGAGSSFAHVGVGKLWTITDGVSGVVETISLSNSAIATPTDWAFV